MRRRVLTSIVAAVAVLAAAGCELRLAAPPGAGVVRYRDALFGQVTKTADVAYGSARNQAGQLVTLRMDVYQPTGDTVAARPVIVLVHGGSFRTGSRTSPEIVDQATTYARQGFVTASISYRLATDGCTGGSSQCIQAIRDAKHDAQAAVRFLRSKAGSYRLDTTRIAIAGTSAGGITALEVAYGPEDVGASGTPGPSSVVRSAVALSGAKILSSPSAGEAPALLFHGTSDVVVPYAWATGTVRDARAAGLVAELNAWQGAGHVPYSGHRTEILAQTTNFLWWTMDLAAAAH
ncbi:MAG TPA: alpha/beta hydrolase [Aquihabitans sp.]|jgi:acetyl esterase/lipase|nr:alpha/beta hydrolase [Aquihabitans sp.]